jgi:hypothetical protein
MEPHSPWQKMVDARQRELRISWRLLEKKLAKKFTYSTIRAWTFNKEGFPKAESYTEEINRMLAEALELKPELLAQAYEDSRRHLIITDKSAGAKGPLSVLRRLFADSKQTIWTSDEIVKLIDDLQGH